MTDKEKDCMWAGAAIATLLFVFIDIVAGMSIATQYEKHGKRVMQGEAVKRGYGHWNNDELGNGTFEWNEK